MSGNTAGILQIVIYFVFIFGIFYFVGIRPQKKEQKKQQDMLSNLAVGDYVRTTSGFYGQIIDITDEMVIVEFGNKNCRIPMLKAAVAEIEKATTAASAPAPKSSPSAKTDTAAKADTAAKTDTAPTADVAPKDAAEGKDTDNAK